MAITVKHTKVSTVPDTTDTDLVRPSDWNADHTLTGLGTMAEQNANNVAITGGSISGATVSGYIPTSEKGAALGVATLDAGGKVPTSQIPLQGDLNYQGTWNATTNTPTLTSSVGTKGYYYVVDVAGTTNLNGITDWQIGDWAIYNGTVWQKVDNTDAVTSVNGYTGTVVLTQPDIAGTANAPTNTNITSMTGVTGGISSPDFVQFDTTVSPVEAVAKLQWDDGNGTLQLGLKGGNVNLQVGQEIVALCYNDSGVALTDGQIVYISGAQGNRVAVKLALATTDGTSAGTLGMVTESIPIGGEGFITIMGVVNKLNTSGLTQGAILYLSPTVAGAYTATKPTAPQHTVTIGYVERVSSTVGSIYIKVDNGYELDELHNVLITTPTGGQLLAYDQTNAVWKNINLTDGTAISITEATGGAVTITNTAPDQVVALTGAGTTTITGTYPNFTISSDDQFDGTVTSVDLTAGTGISVSGGPITSSGSITVTNTAPDQVVAISAGTGISTSGTYPNFTVANTDTGSSQAIFKNVAVSGQSTIVADTNNDTLTVAAGAGVTLTTDATTDTLTITTVAVWGA